MSKYGERKAKKMQLAIAEKEAKELKIKMAIAEKEAKKKRYLEMQKENEYLKRKQQNLNILKEFLSADDQLKRNLIFRDEWLQKKKKEDEKPKLEELMKFVEFLMQTLFFEEHEYKNKKITSDMLLEKEKQLVMSKHFENLIIIEKADFKLDWDSIHFKETKDLFQLIFRFQSITTPKNLSSNDIYEELFKCKVFLTWVISRYPNFEDSDTHIYFLFKKDLRKLGLKLYKKCYYFKTPKGTKPKPSKEKKEEEKWK